MSHCEEKSCCEETSCHDEKAERCHGGGDLMEHVMHMWKSAGCKAWQEVVTDILKEKIRKEYGAQLEKGAEAFVASMGAGWQAKVAQAKAQVEFRKAVEKGILG